MKSRFRDHELAVRHHIEGKGVCPIVRKQPVKHLQFLLFLFSYRISFLFLLVRAEKAGGAPGSGENLPH